METISENPAPENTAENPATDISQPPETTPETTGAPQNSEPVNAVAEPVAPSELITKRGPGRPKGSKTKNRRDQSGRFVPAATAADILPATPEASAPQFISSIPGEPAPSGQAEPGTSQIQETPAPSPAPVDYQATAVLMVGMGTAALATIFGPEWNPENEDEKNQLVAAVKIYLETKQTPDIPPGAMLAIVLAIYSSKRLHQPTTKGKLIRAWLWLKGKFSRRKPAPIATPQFHAMPATV